MVFMSVNIKGRVPVTGQKISRSITALLLAIVAISALANDPASAADPQIMTTASTCTGAWGTGYNAYAGPASKIFAPSGATITSATIPYASASTKNTVRLSIYTNSGSLPGTLLGYLSYSSEASNVATLSGTPIVLPSSGYYWVQIGATSSQMNCYTNTANYVGSNSGWISYAGVAYGATGSGYTPTSWTAFSSPQSAYQINFSLFGTETGSGSVELVNPQNSAVYRISTTVTANMTGVGKITFYHNNKVISSCRSLNVSGSTVTCTWRPAFRGATTLFAIFKPTGGNPIKSNVVHLSVGNRATKR